jgi:hypothetical protein
MTVFNVIEKIPRIITVMTKNDSSGNTGERRGSAVLPSDVRMEGVMMRNVIMIMNSNIMPIDPFGGGGGGGDEPLAMDQRE